MSLKSFLIFFLFLLMSTTAQSVNLEKNLFQQELIGTHNSFASKAYGWGIRNQRKSIYEQLKSGARGLMLDIHLYKGEVKFCHNTCKLTRRLLRIGRPVPDVYGILGEIKRFLNENPKEIIVIRLEDYVGNKKFQEALLKAGLGKFLLKRSESRLISRPLKDMVNQGKRLIIFSDKRSWEYIHYSWNYWSETDWKGRKFDGCKLLRGNPLRGQKILSLNSFNKRSIKKKKRACQKRHGRVPNFTWLDFY